MSRTSARQLVRLVAIMLMLTAGAEIGFCTHEADLGSALAPGSAAWARSGPVPGGHASLNHHACFCHGTGLAQSAFSPGAPVPAPGRPSLVSLSAVCLLALPTPYHPPRHQS